MRCGEGRLPDAMPHVNDQDGAEIKEYLLRKEKNDG
jgi:hypothetical protein